MFTVHSRREHRPSQAKEASGPISMQHACHSGACVVSMHQALVMNPCLPDRQATSLTSHAFRQSALLPALSSRHSEEPRRVLQWALLVPRRDAPHTGSSCCHKNALARVAHGASCSVRCLTPHTSHPTPHMVFTRSMPLAWCNTFSRALSATDLPASACPCMPCAEHADCRCSKQALSLEAEEGLWQDGYLLCCAALGTSASRTDSGPARSCEAREAHAHTGHGGPPTAPIGACGVAAHAMLSPCARRRQCAHPVVRPGMGSTGGAASAAWASLSCCLCALAHLSS